MALGALATTADLQARGIATTDIAGVEALLDSASEAIRDAAGSIISRAESTIKLSGTGDYWLTVPLSPIHAVTAVAIDGGTVSDFRLREGRLWRASGWQVTPEPPEVTLTVDHGFDEVPADIIDLCCSLVAAGLAAKEGGYDPERGLSSMSIDDYREGYTKGDDEILNPLELPQRTREWLRQRFGGGSYVVSTY